MLQILSFIAWNTYKSRRDKPFSLDRRIVNWFVICACVDCSFSSHACLRRNSKCLRCTLTIFFAIKLCVSNFSWSSPIHVSFFNFIHMFFSTLHYVASYWSSWLGDLFDIIQNLIGVGQQGFVECGWWRKLHWGGVRLK